MDKNGFRGEQDMNPRYELLIHKFKALKVF
jgi:hypothetical protein